MSSHGRLVRLMGGVALLIAVAVLVRAQAVAKDANPFLGSWKLNVKRSKLVQSPPPGASSIRIYEDGGGGLMLHTVIFTDSKGGGFTFAAVKYDGKEYPVYYSGALGALLTTGAKSTALLTYTKVDAFTLQYSDKNDDRIMDRATCTVSKDGKTMTETVMAFDKDGKETHTVIEVWDKL